MIDSPAARRHVLGLSGGKDSAALAVYMRDKVPEMEYFFTDTGAELPETYEFLDKLEAYLGRPIERLVADRDFDHVLKTYGGFLPSPNTRWCTRELKLKPFEKWIGDDEVVTYIAIRADEPRDGYISTKPSISALFPFKEAGLGHADILRILDQAGLGLPEYYKWRSRSGCYFCFFQRKSEWIGLMENHPDLFAKAKQYEKEDPLTGARYTWSSTESLDELGSHAENIKARSNLRLKGIKVVSWQEQVAEGDDAEDQACLICHV